MLGVVITLAVAAVLVPVVRALCGCSWATAASHVGVYAVGALLALGVTAALGLPTWLVAVVVVACDPLARRLAPLPRPTSIGGRGARRGPTA